MENSVVFSKLLRGLFEELATSLEFLNKKYEKILLDFDTFLKIYLPTMVKETVIGKGKTKKT